MYVLESSWSAGVLFGLPAALVALVMIWVGAWLWHKFDKLFEPTALTAAIVAGICTVAVLGGCAWAYYPYSAEYHQWRTEGGTVSDVSNRLIAAGTKGGSDQKFVVRFEGSARQYGCNDTRCAAVKVGDDLTLSCKRAWQYAGTDGYDCNFVDLRAAS